MATNHVEYVISLKDLFSQQIGKAKKETDELNKSVDKTSDSLGGLAKMAVGAFATIGIGNFIRDVVEVGASFESAEMGLKTFLGSSEAAHSAFLNIQKDAATTPFDFQSLLSANRALISSGVSAEQARKDVLNLGNAIAATGGGSDELSRMSVNLQQIKNVGKASAMDIKQFAFAGINIYGLLATATGKNVEQVKDMTVSYDLLAYALQQAGKEGGLYYQGLENASNTTTGKLSNLSDQFDAFKGQLFNEMKPAITSIVNALSSFMGKTIKLIGWMKAHKEEIKWGSVALSGLVLAYKAAWIQQKIFALWNIRSSIALGISKIATFASIVATDGLTGALYAAGIGGQFMWNTLLLGIPLVVAGIGYAWNKFEGFRGVIMGLWEVIKGLAISFKDLVVGFYTLDFTQMKKGFNSLFDISKNFNKGYNSEITKKTATKKEDLKDVAKKPSKTTNIFSPDQITNKTTASKVQQKQATQIHINIGKLIENQNIKVENATKDFTQKLHTAVAEVLLNVVNDANRIATQ
ncbi:MAG: tape measure protein [Bacteroidota bacterium]